MTTYLGQPCPIITPLVVRHSGKKGTNVDTYRANLSAAAWPGQGHNVLHDQLHSLLQAIMKVGGMLSTKEPATFLLGKVGNPHITPYVNHVARKNKGNSRSQHAIVSDIHAMNFPAGTQSINDSGYSKFLR